MIGRALLGLFLGSCALLCLDGCARGPRLFPVEGFVLQDEKPVYLAEGEVLQVIFYPEEGTDSSYAAELFEDASFVAYVPAGRYKIVVVWRDAEGNDKLQGGFDREHTPFVQEVTSDDLEPITLELKQKK